jgi:hypothetical protein
MVARIEQDIADRMQKPLWNFQTQRFEMPAITNLVQDASRSRAALGLSTQIDVVPRDAAEPNLLSPEREAELVQAGRYAFGSVASLVETGNAALSFFQVTPGPQTQRAVDRIAALNEETLIAYRNLTEGKVAQEAVNQFQNVLPTPARIRTTPRDALSEITSVIRFYEGAIIDAQNTVNDGVTSAAEKQRLTTLINTARRQIAEYGAIAAGINVGLTGTPVDLSQFKTE